MKKIIAFFLLVGALWAGYKQTWKIDYSSITETSSFTAVGIFEVGADTTTAKIKLNGLTGVIVSPEITGLEKITWNDGTIQTTAAGGAAAAGDPDISFSYMGDIYNSTSPFVLNGTISKYSFTVAKYDVDIGSATTDSFDIYIATKSLGGSWNVAETFTVPAGVSSHTYTSSGYTISEGVGVDWGFANVDATDPAGDIMIKIGN